MHFVQIRSYDNYIQANIQLNLLKEHGINCHLKDENTVTIDPFLSPAIGGMKLMVLNEDLSKAISLLDAATDAYLQTLPCPSCGAKTLERQTHVTSLNWWNRWIARLRGNAESVFTSEVICRSCGNRVTDLGFN